MLSMQLPRPTEGVVLVLPVLPVLPGDVLGTHSAWWFSVL